MQHPTLPERLIAALVHLLALVGVMHLVINLVGWPLFPVTSFLFLLPNLSLLLLSLLCSPFVRAHATQAIAIHVAGLSLGLIPQIIRMLVSGGMLGEQWQYTGWGGNGFTPVWALMTMIIAFSGLFIFSATVEASMSALGGGMFRYPLVGKLVSRR